MIRKLLLFFVVFSLFVQSANCFPVKGKAVQADGKTPAADVVVQATHMRESVPGKKDDFILKTKTAADGTFSLELPPWNDMYNVCLLNNEGRYYWGQAHINGNVDLGTIKLQLGCELAGKVRTKEGKALQNVDILLQLKLKVCTHYIDAAKTTSAADGSFLLKDLSPGEYMYQLKADAYSVKPGTIHVTEDPCYLELVLEKAATIKGLIKDEQGKPVAGVRIAAENVSAESDSAGRYVLKGLPPGSFYLSLGGNGYVQKEETGRAQVKCEAGKEVEKNFAVTRGGGLRLELELTDRNDKIPDRLSVVFSQAGQGRYSYNTSYQYAAVTNGVAIFKDIIPADYSISIKKGEATWLTTNLTIVAGQEVKQHVVLPHVFEIKGKVTDETGKALEHASVSARPQKKKEDKTDDGADRLNYLQDRQEQQSVTTDKEGKYVLEGLSEGASIKIHVSHQNYAITNRTVVVKKEHLSEDFVLGKGLKISGSVLESDGKPAGGIEVYLSVRYTPGVGAENYAMMSEVSRNAKVDEKGGFELSGLVPGKYDLNFYKTDDNMRETETTLSGVTAGTDDVIVSLGKKQTVSGVITDKQGTALGKVNINVSKAQDGRNYRSFSRGDKEGNQSGTDGKFTLTLRSGAKYTINFNLYPYVQKTVTVDLGVNAQPPLPMKVELERGYKVTGTVLDSKEHPVPGAIISVSSQGGMFGSMWMPGETDDDEEDGAPGRKTNDKGKFSLDGVSPGIVSISVGIKTNNMVRALTSKEVLIAKDKPNEVKINLPGMGTVKGRVVNAEGKPVSQSAVSLYSPKGGANMSEQTDENGKFIIENVPEGSYMAMWYDVGSGSSGTGMRPVTVMVKAGGISEITLGAEQPKSNAMTVSGLVRKNGKPLGKGELTLSPVPKEDADETEIAAMYGSYARGHVDENGGFVVSNVTAGAYCYRITQGKIARPVADDEEEAGTASYFSGEVVIAAGQSKLEININGLTITGAVTGADGKPAAKSRVVMTPASAKDTAKWMLARYGVADAGGAYKLECIPPGKYDLTVSTATEGTGGLKNVEVSESAKRFDIKLGLAFQLSGKITMADGENPEGAVVMAVSEDELGGGWAQVANTGEYEMDPKLPKGKYTVFVNRQGCAVEVAILNISSNTKHDIQLVAGGNLQIKATSKGKPAKGQIVRVKAKSGEEVIRQRGKQYNAGMMAGWYASPTDLDGSTIFQGLKPGKYVIYTDGSKATTTAEIKALETTEAELKL